MRFLALGWMLALPALAPAVALAGNAASTAAPAPAAVQGVVADSTGAIVPGAEVDLVDPSGAVAGTIRSDGEGNFQLAAPHAGNFTLVVSDPGFETVRTPVVIAAPAAAAVAKAAAVLPALARVHIVLPIAAVAATVRVNGDQASPFIFWEISGRQP